MKTCLKNGETILFIGDSITDCGRRDAPHRPLGAGYVTFLRDFFIIREPEKKITVLNTGCGGNTIEDLRSRWVDDALAHKPDWLAIKIGINDINRWCSDEKNAPLQSPKSFEEIFIQLIEATRKALPSTRLLLIDPFYGSLDIDGPLDSYRGRVSKALPNYLSTLHKMADTYKTLHVKTNDVFHEHLKHHSPTICFPAEPVHPNQTGHMIIAEAVYDALSI